MSATKNTPNGESNMMTDPNAIIDAERTVDYYEDLYRWDNSYKNCTQLDEARAELARIIQADGN